MSNPNLLTVNRQYGIGGFLKKNAGIIGTGLGAGVGALVGNPVMGAKIGGMAGGAVQSMGGNSGGGKKASGQRRSAPPQIPGFGGTLAHQGTAGFEKGGFLPLGQDASRITGPSHEQGGVQVEGGAEVEGGETIDFIVDGEDVHRPGQKSPYVFSKRLTVPGTKKSFADYHETLVSRGVGDDKIKQLANLQESISGRKGSRSFALGGFPNRSRRIGATMSVWPDELLEKHILAESAGDPNAVSSAGAKGLAQIMPDTARDPGFGVEPVSDPNDPEEARRFMKEYMGAMLEEFDGNPKDALRAYNWGPGNVKEWIDNGRNPQDLPDETKDYIGKLGPEVDSFITNASPERLTSDPGEPTFDLDENSSLSPMHQLLNEKGTFQDKLDGEAAGKESGPQRPETDQFTNGEAPGMSVEEAKRAAAKTGRGPYAPGAETDEVNALLPSIGGPVKQMHLDMLGLTREETMTPAERQAAKQNATQKNAAGGFLRGINFPVVTPDNRPLNSDGSFYTEGDGPKFDTQLNFSQDAPAGSGDVPPAPDVPVVTPNNSPINPDGSFVGGAQTNSGGVPPAPDLPLVQPNNTPINTNGSPVGSGGAQGQQFDPMMVTNLLNAGSSQDGGGGTFSKFLNFGKQLLPYAGDILNIGRGLFGDSDIPDAPQASIPRTAINEARKMPTEVNVKPQLANVDRSFRNLTASGDTSTQAKLAAHSQSLQARDKILAQKENQENQLEAQKAQTISQLTGQFDTRQSLANHRANVRQQQNQLKADAAQSQLLQQGIAGAARTYQQQQAADAQQDSQMRAIMAQLSGKDPAVQRSIIESQLPLIDDPELKEQLLQFIGQSNS